FYAYALPLLVLLYVSHKRIVWGQVVASLLYVNNYYQAIKGDPNTFLSHTWSLAIEEQFYLLWPLTFVLLRRHPRRLAQALLTIIGFVWVYRWVLIPRHVPQGYIYEAFDTRADQLIVGCLLAVALRHGWWPRLWEILCSRTTLPAITLMALIGSATCGYW